MHKLKKYTIALIISAMLATSPLNVYAVPVTDAETTEEPTETNEETEEGNESEETAEGDSGQWLENKNDGTWSYQIDNKNVTGWYKVGDYWYYFNGKGIMLANTKVGTYIIDGEGHLTNGSDAVDFTPAPHGVIYNSSTMNILKNGHDAADDVTEKINNLYDMYQNNKKLDDEQIKEARYLYNSLPLSEKVRVNNESKLAEMENSQGIVYDYSTIYATSTDASEADGTSKKGNTYTFTIDEKHDSLTVITRFTTDTDMDGNGDIPVIQLISPQGESLPITNDSPQIRNASLNAALTWTENFMQIDVASAENGNWTIMTDIVCTFTSQEYIGNRQNINPIPAEERDTKTDAETTEKKEEKTNEGKGALIFLGVVVVLFVGLIIWMKKMPMGGDNKTKKKKNEEAKPVLSKEEQMEILKRELQQMDAEYNDNTFDDNSDNIARNPAKIQQRTFSQDEINESLEDYSVNSDILTSNASQQSVPYNTPSVQPVQPNIQPVQPTQPVQPIYQQSESQMQQVQQPVNQPVQQPYQTYEQPQETSAPNAGYDEWYEEDE